MTDGRTERQDDNIYRTSIASHGKKIDDQFSRLTQYKHVTDRQKDRWTEMLKEYHAVHSCGVLTCDTKLLLCNLYMCLYRQAENRCVEL